MRPDIFKNRGIIAPQTLNPGLFQFDRMSYNPRHLLPVVNRPVQGNDGSDLPYEAAMKPTRKSRKPDNPVVEEQPSASDNVETRAERLARIKREIEAGTYETPEKLDAAIERMLGVW